MPRFLRGALRDLAAASNWLLESDNPFPTYMPQSLKFEHADPPSLAENQMTPASDTSLCHG
jgi:hypothetical protein